MNQGHKTYFFLIIWILSLMAIGGIIGSLINLQVGVLYSTVHDSFWQNPLILFHWIILYSIIGAYGWLIWCSQAFRQLSLVKVLYMIQLVLNWICTPLFYHYRLIGLVMGLLVVLDILIGLIMYLTYSKIRVVSKLMIPYLLWFLFGTLNFYIWQYQVDKSWPDVPEN